MAQGTATAAATSPAPTTIAAGGSRLRGLGRAARSAQIATSAVSASRFQAATGLVITARPPSAPAARHQASVARPVAGRCSATVTHTSEAVSGSSMNTSVLAFGCSSARPVDPAKSAAATSPAGRDPSSRPSTKTSSAVADSTSEASSRGASMFSPKSRKLSAYQP